jgi:hypothetical protein
MVKFVKGALLVGVVGLAFTGVASATPSATDFKCEASVSKAGGKFVGSKSKCAIKCYGAGWKGTESFTDCMPPYAGAAAACIIDNPLKPGKAAEEAFVTAMQKSCDPAVNPKNTCPNCYDSGNCTAAGFPNDHQQFTEGQVDTFGPLVFCELGPANKNQQKCQLNTAKVLSKYAAGVTKCYDKCLAAQLKGTTNGTCTPPSPSDSITAACVSKAQGASIAGVDKICQATTVPPSKTLCQTTQPCTSNGDCTVPAVCDTTTNFCAGEYLSGAGFTNLVDLAVSNNVPSVYCESPSGAFVE